MERCALLMYDIFIYLLIFQIFDVAVRVRILGMCKCTDSGIF